MTDLFGAPAGRREVRVEWGLRATKDTYCRHKGQVELCAGEAHARLICGDQYHGGLHTEVVSRTVTIFTTPWGLTA